LAIEVDGHRVDFKDIVEDPITYVYRGHTSLR
jgi:hypothetical protein